MNDSNFEIEVLNADPVTDISSEQPQNDFSEQPQNTPSEPPKNNPLLKKKFCFASITYLLQIGFVLLFTVISVFGFLQNSYYLKYTFQYLKCIFSSQPLPENEYMEIWGMSSFLPLVSSMFNLIIYLIIILSLAVMSIMLFAKVNKPIVILPLTGFMLSNIVFIVKGFVYSEMAEYFETFYSKNLSDLNYWGSRSAFSDDYAPLLPHIFVLTTSLLTFIFVLLLAIKSKQEQKEKTIIQKIWFIPCLIRVFTLVTFPAEYLMNHWDAFMGTSTESTLIYSFIYSIEPVLIYLPLIVSEFLLCMWLANPYKKPRKKKKPQPVQPVQPAIQYVPVMQPAAELNAAQQLMEYKNLLDMGAITQEEYEAKKKQILGL